MSNTLKYILLFVLSMFWIAGFVAASTLGKVVSGLYFISSLCTTLMLLLAGSVE